MEAACNLAFIVRTVGERTEELCVDLIRRSCGGDDTVTIIREPTHAGAIEHTLSVAAEQGCHWAVAVDADILMYPGALPGIRKELASRYAQASVVHFAVSDKLYRMRRWAGVKVYTREAAREGLPLLREIRSEPNLKIERALITALERAGRMVRFSRTDVALHDFFQYYTDLYRKSYLNAVRNTGITRRAQRPWRRMRVVDPDYAVILKAARDAADEKKQLSNSIADFDRTVLMDRVRSLGLEEKQALDCRIFTEWDMNACLDARRVSLRKHKVSRDFFEQGPLQQLARRLSRRLEYMRLAVGRRVG